MKKNSHFHHLAPYKILQGEVGIRDINGTNSRGVVATRFVPAGKKFFVEEKFGGRRRVEIVGKLYSIQQRCVFLFLFFSSSFSSSSSFCFWCSFLSLMYDLPSISIVFLSLFLSCRNFRISLLRTTLWWWWYLLLFRTRRHPLLLFFLLLFLLLLVLCL